MEHTIRRSRRLAQKRRRVRQPPRMSIGEAYGTPAGEGDGVNLAEARAMNSARKAAARLGGDKGKGKKKPKNKKRAKSLTPSKAKV